jgi:hypothetical protein
MAGHGMPERGRTLARVEALELVGLTSKVLASTRARAATAMGELGLGLEAASCGACR